MTEVCIWCAGSGLCCCMCPAGVPRGATKCLFCGTTNEAAIYPWPEECCECDGTGLRGTYEEDEKHNQPSIGFCDE